MASGIVRAGQPVSVPTPTAADHAATKDYVDDADALKANDSAVVHLTGNETIAGQKTIDSGSGNQWIFNQPPQVAVGSLATHAVRRDDSRLTDARTPTAHVHAGGDITSGTIAAARLPLVPNPPVALTYGTAPTIDASLGNYRTMTMTGDATVGGTVSNGVDGQILRLRSTASGAQRVLTLHANLIRPSHIGSTLTIPSAKKCDLLIAYDGSNWYVMSAQVYQ